MRRLVLFVSFTVLVVSCGSGPDPEDDPEDQTDPVTSVSTTLGPDDSPQTYELGCETVFSIYMDFGGDFEGYATPQEAAESWTPGTMGVPDGKWRNFEDNRWILVSDEGETVARTEVNIWPSNASTTFATERYVSGEIEYCE